MNHEFENMSINYKLMLEDLAQSDNIQPEGFFANIYHFMQDFNGTKIAMQREQAKLARKPLIFLRRTNTY